MRTVIFLFSLLWALLLLLPAVVVTRAAVSCANGSERVPCGTAVVSAPVNPTAAADFLADAAKKEAAAVRFPMMTASGMTEIALEDYVRGVLMAELPASFDADAWRALAVAVRTYACYRQAHGMELSDDSAVCCAYLSDSAAAVRFGDAYETVWEKANAAVRDTMGEILSFDGEAACSVFHAMSHKATASAESVWGGEMPYLVSVSTPEEDIDGLISTVTLEEAAICARLGVGAALPLTVIKDKDGRVGEVLLSDGSRCSGVRFRALLGLRSTAITVRAQDADRITLEMHGYGHGVGLSQWGAHLMAAADVGYREILAHYYPGTTLMVLP